MLIVRTVTRKTPDLNQAHLPWVRVFDDDSTMRSEGFEYLIELLIKNVQPILDNPDPGVDHEEPVPNLV